MNPLETGGTSRTLTVTNINLTGDTDNDKMITLKASGKSDEGKMDRVRKVPVVTIIEPESEQVVEILIF